MFPTTAYGMVKDLSTQTFIRLDPIEAASQLTLPYHWSKWSRTTACQIHETTTMKFSFDANFSALLRFQILRSVVSQTPSLKKSWKSPASMGTGQPEPDLLPFEALSRISACIDCRQEKISILFLNKASGSEGRSCSFLASAFLFVLPKNSLSLEKDSPAARFQTKGQLLSLSRLPRLASVPRG